MNISINGSNSYYIYGLKLCIELLLKQTGDINFVVSDDADVAFFEFSHEYLFDCERWMQKKNGVVLVCYSVGVLRTAQYFPECFRDVLFFDKETALLHVLKECLKRVENKIERIDSHCAFCKKMNLSKQQGKLLTCFSRGLTTLETARLMNISPRTVFSHKYILMRKFGVNSDSQLLKLINCLTFL